MINNNTVRLVTMLLTFLAAVLSFMAHDYVTCGLMTVLFLLFVMFKPDLWMLK